MDTYDWYFLPVHNPDGYAKTWDVVTDPSFSLQAIHTHARMFLHVIYKRNLNVHVSNIVKYHNEYSQRILREDQIS